MPALFGPLLGDGWHACEASPDTWPKEPSPYDAEERAIARAVGRRQQEYRTSRGLFRRALAGMGMAPRALLNRSDRSPCWPDGVVGSITHTQGWCAVALGARERWQGVGIDVEVAAPIQESVFTRVLTTRERAVLACYPDSQRLLLARLYFSAKESVYKCQYPTTERYLGFEEVEIDFDFERGSFAISFMPAGDPLPAEFSAMVGRFRSTASLLATVAILEATR